MPSPTFRLTGGAAAALINALAAGVTVALVVSDAPHARVGDQLLQLLTAGLALAAIYDLDRRLNPSAPLLMRVGSESGAIAAALLFACGGLGFRLGVNGGQLASEEHGLAVWLTDALRLGALPGLGLWAALAGWTSLRTGLAPRWTGAAGVALGAAGVAAFLVPSLDALFYAVAAVWWAGVGLTLGSPRAGHEKAGPREGGPAYSAPLTQG